MKRFVALVCLAALGAGLYVYLQDDGSKHIRTEMSALIGDMQIKEEWKQEAQALFDTVHKKAFEAALDVTKRLGQKFDDDTYYDKVFEMMQQRARDEGKTDLADKLAEQKALFALNVTEK